MRVRIVLVVVVLVGLASLVPVVPRAQAPSVAFDDIGDLPDGGIGSVVGDATSAGGMTDAVDASEVSVNAPQAALTITSIPAGAANGSSFTVGTAGGSGTGLVSYTASGACTVWGSLIIMISDSGVCTIGASKAGDADFEAATAPVVTVNATVPT